MPSKLPIVIVCASKVTVSSTHFGFEKVTVRIVA